MIDPAINFLRAHRLALLPYPYEWTAKGQRERDHAEKIARLLRVDLRRCSETDGGAIVELAFEATANDPRPLPPDPGSTPRFNNMRSFW